MDKKRILFIVNVKSGASENSDVEETIRAKMKVKDYDWDIFPVSGEDIKERLTGRIDDYKPGIAVAAGGDGTINLVASLIAGSQIRLGIIPLGSANGLANELGIPEKLTDAIELVLTGRTRPLDIIRINGTHISLHLSDVGINARIIKEFEKEGKRGLMAYFRHFMKELFKPQPAFVSTILVGGKIHNHRAYMILIANCNKYGTGAVINPSGKWDDGKFEVVVVRPHRRWIWKSLIGVFTGTFHLQPHIDVYQCESAVIRVIPPQEFQVDGETLGKSGEIRPVIEPQAINVISVNQEI